VSAHVHAKSFVQPGFFSRFAGRYMAGLHLNARRSLAACQLFLLLIDSLALSSPRMRAAAGQIIDRCGLEFAPFAHSALCRVARDRLNATPSDSD
jgi:hypothetical protein